MPAATWPSAFYTCRRCAELGRGVAGTTVATEVEPHLTLPFAALGALIAALIDTTVVPELPIAGATPDIVLLFTVVATMLMQPEDGLVWATVGGLLLDILTPARPLGATTLALLLVVGLAIVANRALGQRRRITAVVGVFILSWLFHAALLLVLVIVEGVSPGTFQPRLVLIAAVLNTILAVPVAVGVSALGRRFAFAERADW